MKTDNTENIAYNSVRGNTIFLGSLDEVIDNPESEGRDLENADFG